MTSALGKALAAIGAASAFVSQLEEVSPPPGDDAPPNGEPPRGTDQLRGLLAQLGDASVQALLRAGPNGVGDASATSESDDDDDDDDDELIMTELDPSEVTRALARQAAERAAAADESSDDEPLESAPLALDTTEIAELARVNAGRPRVPKVAPQPQSLAMANVVYDEHLVAFLTGGYRAFAHLADKAARRDHGARRAAVSREKSALAALKPSSAPELQSPSYSPLHRSQRPPGTIRRMDLDRASPAKFRSMKRGPAVLGGFLGTGDAGAARRASFALEPFADLVGRGRPVGLALPPPLRRSPAPEPPARGRSPKTAAAAIAFAGDAPAETVPAAAGDYAAWLAASGGREAARAVLDASGSLAGAVLEKRALRLARALGLRAQPGHAGRLDVAWNSVKHGEPWSAFPVDRTVAVCRGSARAVLAPPRATCPDSYDLDGEPRRGLLWPDAASAHFLTVALDAGEALYVPAAWAVKFEPVAALGANADHLVFAASYWRTACRDLAPYVPIEVLGAPEDAVPL